ncbi:MAG: hypothetical protein KAS32_24945 [Candidatus Peribacteraceae bacterium]|nr:hypothetical protein [Candidatus Peribacteraceae bacterium]
MQGTINDYAVIVNNVLKHIAPKTTPTVRSEYLDFMYKVQNSERTYTDVGVTGLGMAQIISDGGIGASDAPIQGYSKNYVQMHFTKKVRLTFQTNFFLFESAAAKIKGTVKKKVLEGKNSIEHAKNYLAQSLLAQGFVTSFTWTPINSVGTSTPVSTVGADAVEYWSQAHPREDGGAAWSNVIVDGATSSPQFTYSSLLAARRLHSVKKDGRGNPLVSDLDCLVCRRGSTTAQFAKTIKATIDKGLAPQQTNLFNNAPATETFKIVELSPYQNLAMDGLMWGMMDTKMMNEDYGFKYIEALPTRAEPAVVDLLGNQDLVLNFNSLAVMGASDLRGWMWSDGDGATV